jgi:hypothetical protein
MTVAGTGSIGDAANALIASLGGSANEGAHPIADAGQNAEGTIAAIGAATDQYNQEVAPLLAAEGAEQRVNQSNKNAQKLITDKAALAALQSSEGQAQQAALAQIQGENNSLAQARASMAAQILGNNNALRQQTFGNQIALANSIAAAASMGLKANLTQSEIARNDRSGMRSAWAAAHPFAAASPKERESAATAAASALKDPTGTAWLKMSPQQAWQKVSDVYRGLGYSPDPGTPSYTAAQSVLNLWQSGTGG